MKTWSIEGYKLKRLIVNANSFDEALAIARRVNKNYTGGCVIEIEGHPVDNYYKMKGNK